MYINDLLHDTSSDAKRFTEDTCLFTVVYDKIISANQLNRDLKIISEWAYQWKIQFNPDINKQAVQVIFSQKRNKSIHPSLLFNEAPVVMKDEQKRFSMILDSVLNFHSHVKKIDSTCRGTGVIPLLVQVCFSPCLRSNVQAVCEIAS